MQCIETEKQQENSSIEIINRFGTTLVSSRKLLEIFELVGKAVHALLPEAMLYTSQVVRDESYMPRNLAIWLRPLSGSH